MGSKKAKWQKKEADRPSAAATSIAGLAEVFKLMNRGNLRIKQREEITVCARLWLDLGDKEKAKEIMRLHDAIENEEKTERERDEVAQRETAERETGEVSDQLSTPLRASAGRKVHTPVQSPSDVALLPASSPDDSIGDLVAV